MTEPLLIRRQRDLLRNLVQLASDRVTAQSNAELSFESSNQAGTQQFEEARQHITARHQGEKELIEREYHEVRQNVLDNFDSSTKSTQREFSDTRDSLTGEYEAGEEKTHKELHDARWESTALLDANKESAKSLCKEALAQIAARVDKLRACLDEAVRLLDEWRQPRDYNPINSPGSLANREDHPHRKSEECLAQAELLVALLKALRVPRLFKGNRLRWMFVTLWVASLLPIFLPTPIFRFPILLVVGTASSILLSLGFRTLLYAIAKAQVAKICQPLSQVISDGEEWSKRAEAEEEATYRDQRDEMQNRYNHEVRAAEEKCARELAKLKQLCDAGIRQADEKYPRLLIEMQQQREFGLRQVDEHYPRVLTELDQSYDKEISELDEKYRCQLEESQSHHDEDWNAIIRNWHDGLAKIHAEVAQINQECRRLFADWSVAAANEWVAATDVPSVIRFGSYEVRMDQIPNGVPDDERLRTDPPHGFSLPALLPFPAGCSTLLKAKDQVRERAVHSLQAVMLRFLTSVPPGKLRFTIIDPVGLGENFAGFMHLADFDEAMVTNRIWTEPQHIDQRLADLTEHMENVIQKYLRNEFETIEEYNVKAGEVAEPFRIVVVANFPANFSESAARRLVSIASSGARCGVFTLVSVDTRLPLPHGFRLSDLERHAVNLAAEGDRFIWNDADFERFSLTLDAPPPASYFTQVLQAVGEKAKDASRVEVPFEFIAPPPEQYWKGDSRLGLNVPLGRAGATKTQNLRLGQGTAQHVLIAGKTGSGKSTLLHALITNLSLLYSPEEVELYLVDFKKGVEFKTYATYELPHARVVAIESEREFGLSVLQRLDAELKRRGDRYREVGAQDLASYRQASGNSCLPRILLIVDEFQEFFVEDDKIAQEAALLLDRLVRQGRAFGIHVELGSQTLGGAYSLARSTLGQMAVRIALQCSESDAHLILSDDNTAARLLSRPGEAIYNDANGLIEGNSFFQVVWLPDERREVYLRRIQELARQHNYSPAQPQIVFEGNTPSDIQKNHLLQRLFTAPTWPAVPKLTQAWLGEAVAIKDPTAAVFRPQGGSNLLLLGQQDESALEIMHAAIVSLAAQHAPADETGQRPGARFFVLDGSPADSPHAGLLSKLAGVVPQPLVAGGVREVAAVIGAVAEEVERRQKEPHPDNSAVYLFIHDLQRFRDLRKQEDDFSFSRRGEDKPASPNKQLGTILREGSPLRVHTIIWCDSVNNMNRAFDRVMIREFDMRVLFQMSAGDSSTLIDTPVAGKLGLHRAIFYSEEQGVVEKFRPYGPPSDGWIEWVKERFQARLSPV